MKRLVIILLALFLLIGGGGGAAYFYFIRPAQQGPETPEQAAAKAKAAAEAKRQARFDKTPNFFECVVPAPLVIKGKVQAYLFLGLKVDVADSATYNKMDQVDRYPIEEKILVELNAHPIPLVANTTNPDLTAAKRQIRAILEADYGKDKINDVLIAMTFLQGF